MNHIRMFAMSRTEYSDSLVHTKNNVAPQIYATRLSGYLPKTLSSGLPFVAFSMALSSTIFVIFYLIYLPSLFICYSPINHYIGLIDY